MPIEHCPNCSHKIHSVGKKDDGNMPCVVFCCAGCNEFWHKLKSGEMLTMHEYVNRRVVMLFDKGESNGPGN